MLANRLKIALKEIIHEDQIGFMENRFYFIEYTKNTKTETSLLFIDFEKAFDTINWNFLLKTIEFYNIGKNVISWV